MTKVNEYGRKLRFCDKTSFKVSTKKIVSHMYFFIFLNEENAPGVRVFKFVELNYQNITQTLLHKK